MPYFSGQKIGQPYSRFIWTSGRAARIGRIITVHLIGRLPLSEALPSLPLVISSPEHKVLRVSYCDHSPSVSVSSSSVVRSHFLVYTLASTNMNQSAPNLVHMYMTIRSRMSSIMELIGPELSELSALELENLPYLTLFTL